MSDQKPTYKPMRVQVGANSKAETNYIKSLGGVGYPDAAALARNIKPEPEQDLIFRGGKTVPQMRYRNIYLGRKSSWLDEDKRSIERAIKLAMQDKSLNKVIQQYFIGKKLECDPLEALSLDEASDPDVIDEPDVVETIVELFETKKISRSDLDVTVFNLILPRGAELRLDKDSSFDGLGGYHGSTNLKNNGKDITLYYSANVFSTPTNGINAFDKSWKNVVGTLYHELNEFRTDADVGEAIRTGDIQFQGWVSRTLREIGDQPIEAATSLRDVFKEILADAEKIPVQFMYSNQVHGAEDPTI